MLRAEVIATRKEWPLQGREKYINGPMEAQEGDVHDTLY